MVATFRLQFWSHPAGIYYILSHPLQTFNPASLRWFGYGTACATVTAGLIAYYPGSPLIFGLFSLCSFALLGLAIPQPRSYAFTFLAGLMFLGFWAKVAVHSLWPSNFVDPVGDFFDTSREWDEALIVSAWGILGVMLPRLFQLWHSRKGSSGGEVPVEIIVPAWYATRRRQLWALTLLVLCAVNIFNLWFAIHQVGANPRILLPLHLNVLIAWMLNVGFSLVISTFVFWDWKLGPSSLGRTLVIPIAAAFCTSVTSMSRLVYLLHTSPYLLALWEKWHIFRTALPARKVLLLLVTFGLGFWLSILAVFWLRANEYYPYAENVPPHDTVTKHMERTMRSQFPQLFVHRWVGLEGVLAVGALKQRNGDLFLAALTEKPESGVNALYQRVAKLNFQAKAPDKFTFLSNAGPVALLYFSGSLWVVMFGMSFATSCLLATEYAARRWLGNPLFLAVSSAALANVLAQTTIPYLSLVFLVQIWVAIITFAIFQNNVATRAAFGDVHGAGTR